MRNLSKKEKQPTNTYLNLGCGSDYLSHPRGEVINVDLNDSVKCDQILDLENDVFPWKDNSIEGIIAKHVVEHIWKRDRFMNECWRVLKPGKEMYIETPTAGTKAYWKDPTHVSGWIPETFKYYCEWNTCPANQRKTWEMVSCETVLVGDENEHIKCRMRKPRDD